MAMKIKMKDTNRGFTLIEVLIALVISSVLMIGIYSAFKTQQDSYQAQDQVVEMQQNIRAGSFILTNEIRMAGFDPTSRADAGITTATRSHLAFTKDDNLDEDTADTGESVILGFSAANDADLDGIVDGGGVASLGMDTGSGFQPLTENIQAVEFYYHLSDGSQTLTPAATELSDIRSIQISILARADKPDRNYTDAGSYVTPSGQTWGSFNDHFRRRFQTVTVACPNMGL